MPRYIMIDSHSGYIWGEQVAESPEAACEALDHEVGRVDHEREYETRLPRERPAEQHYRVYAAAADTPAIDDGQDDAAIAMVEALPLVARVVWRDREDISLVTPYTRILDYRVVTDETLETDREACPARDQAAELVPGCHTWGIVYEGGQRGQMTRWPDGRGAIALGGDSQWGDWIDGGPAGTKAEILALDDGAGWHDDNGEPVCQHGYSLRSGAYRTCTGCAAVALGRRGGQARSPAKTRAARRNAQRPRPRGPSE